MKEISLTRGRSALVDDKDFDELNKSNWHYHVNGRGVGAACRAIKIAKYKYKTQSMASYLLQPAQGYIVDHIDNNPLNNQRSNLRVCTPRNNNLNCAKFDPSTSSKFIGVSWGKSLKKWTACAWINGKSVYLGVFNDETEAAKARDALVLEHRGEFAKLNFSKEVAAARVNVP